MLSGFLWTTALLCYSFHLFDLGIQKVLVETLGIPLHEIVLSLKLFQKVGHHRWNVQLWSLDTEYQWDSNSNMTSEDSTDSICRMLVTVSGKFMLTYSVLMLISRN
jgi:hypothetical protein